MREVVIAAAARLPVGKFGGSLREVPDWKLGVTAFSAAVERADIALEAIDEVIIAQSYRTGDSPVNISRVIAVRAGVPIETPEFTMNKHCGSSLRAVNLAAQIIKAGDADLIVAGGLESMSRAAYMVPAARWGGRLGHGQLLDPLVLYDPLSGCTMGQTGEKLAEQYQISREEQDRFALASEHKAEAAVRSGRFRAEVAPIEVPAGKGQTRLFDSDETPRFGTTMESLAKLQPVFKENGTLTAGNSSKMNDGAGMAVVMSAERAAQLGVKPLARIVSYASAGVPPEIMGIGPVPATKKALAKAGLVMDDIDLIELNEAFASQSIAVIRELKLDLEKLNVNGGAIALGHPIAATGVTILTKLLYEMQRRRLRYGLATLCIGGGQGIATIVENLR
ncbi:MAG: acetyl-CoA C-acetyltransferase [Candidatus Tectomicrobia bacterium]|nr:acetyl-CoA C-acetyltransferase [Candidatus Tectomicrobia bacterium]